MKLLLKFFLNKIIFFLSIPLRINLFNKNIIILQTYNKNLYCESPKYLYEYLSKKTNYDVYWVTSNKQIISYLKKNDLKYISLRYNPLLFLYVTLNAKIVIDSGTSYFNPFNLIKSNVIKITTHHGSGPKNSPTIKFKEIEIENFSKFSFVNYCSDLSLEQSGKNLFKLPSERLIKFGLPRCDQFFDKILVNEKYENKEILNYILNNKVTQNNKIILYTPTWRPYDYDFPLSLMKNFNIESFNKFLEYNNIYFFYSLHVNSLPNKLPKNYRRIIYIDRNKYPFYDTCEFMNEVDILLNDYSATTTDFCLLKRPQIFFLHDYEKYNKYATFTENYIDCIPGKNISSYEEFIGLIDTYLSNPSDYNNQFDQKIDSYLKKYYDIKKGDSLELFVNFIKSKI